ncbi:MAG: transporter substrate-binding domain-containing protein [Spirochaetota bacterium]
MNNHDKTMPRAAIMSRDFLPWMQTVTCIKSYRLIIVLVLLGFAAVGPGYAQLQGGGSKTPPLLFLGNESLPPMIYSRKGEALGLVADLARAMAERMDRPVEIRAMDWAEAQRLVLEGKADALLQINESPERLAYLDFSQSLLVSEFSIFIPADRHGIVSRQDLRGLRVGVEGKGLPIQLLQEEPGILIEVIPDFAIGFEMLAAGAIDAVVVDRWVGMYILAVHHIKGVKVVEVPISRSLSAIAVRKGNTDLLGEINSALGSIKRDGTYDAILESWRSKEVVFRTFEQWSRMERLSMVAIVAALVVALLAVTGQYYTIRRQHRVEQRLRESELVIKKSENRLRVVLETIPEGVAVADAATGHFVFVNESLTCMLGYEKDELYTLIPTDIHPPHEIPRVDAIIASSLRGESVSATEIQVMRKDGTIFLASMETSLLELDSSPCLLGVFSDITERRLYEEKIAALLREKELLLKETHHRVKNNMNTVYSLLSLQARAQQDKGIQSILLDAAGRVQGMRFLYDKLYLSENFRELGVRIFFPPLVEEILGVFSPDPPVSTSLDLDDFVLSAKILSPLAIIINEMVTNSVKYAFDGKTDRQVSLQARKKGSTVTIVYGDNGTGLPDSVNLETSTGFGMQLVGILVEQIDGTINIDRQGGTKYTITVMVPTAKG